MTIFTKKPAWRRKYPAHTGFKQIPIAGGLVAKERKTTCLRLSESLPPKTVEGKPHKTRVPASENQLNGCAAQLLS
ncbi:hypothetical protein N9X53_02860 [Mariniblastus sp.]|nr:hypothetical protein [Mariniblastus sp.]